MTGAGTIEIRRARLDDLSAIVRLLADDCFGAGREIASEPPLPSYVEAFKTLDADPRSLLVVANDGAGAIVGTLQMTFIRGLSNQGAERALVEAVRVRSGLRGRGVGSVMMAWAVDEARARGSRYLQLVTHASRTDAHRFYARLGFEPSHVGFRRRL